MTKADINKRGYNKFLCVSSGVTVSIDESKIEEDKHEFVGRSGLPELPATMEC